jgi:hypothetical protein
MAMRSRQPRSPVEALTLAPAVAFNYVALAGEVTNLESGTLPNPGIKGWLGAPPVATRSSP